MSDSNRESTITQFQHQQWLKAKEKLKEAKKIEQQRLDAGYRYVQIDSRTKVLRKIK